MKISNREAKKYAPIVQHSIKLQKSFDHLNPWYFIALNNLAKKLEQNLKFGKQYRNIPFGHSLIDIKLGSEKTHFMYKTPTEEGWKVREKYTDTENFLYSLQDSAVIEDWSPRFKPVFTPQSLKKISLSISEIIFDSTESHTDWVFPYYNYFVGFERSPDSEGIARGYAYIQEFSELFGSGESVSGNCLSTGPYAVSDNVYKVYFDHEIYRVLSFEFEKKKRGRISEDDYKKI